MSPDDKKYNGNYFKGGDWGSFNKQEMEDLCRNNFTGGGLSTLRDEYEKMGHNLGNINAL